MRGSSDKLDSSLDKSTGKLKGFKTTAQQPIPKDMFSSLADGAASKFTALLGKLAAATAAYFAFKHVISEVNNQMERITGLEKLSQRTGIATDALQGYIGAFRKAGIETDGVQHTILKLSEKLSEASAGGEEAQAVFRELGINFKELNNASPDQKFRATVDAVSKLPNEGDRIRNMFKLFKEEGGSLAQVFKNGSKALDEAAAKTAKFGLTVNPVDAEKVAQAKRAIDDYGHVWESVWQNITVHLAPDIAAVFTMMTDSSLSAKDKLAGVSDAWGMIDDAIAVVEDAIGGLYTAFKSKQAEINSSIGAVVGALGTLYKATDYVLSLFGHKQSATNFFTEWANDLNKLADEETKAATESSKKSLSQRLKDIKTRQAAEAAAKAAGAAHGPSGSSPGFKDSKPIDDLIIKLKEQAATFGQTSRQAEIYAAFIKTGNAALRDQATALDRTLTALEVQKAYMDGQTILPMVKALETYNTALDEGKIDQQQYGELVQDLGAKISGTSDKVVEHSKLLTHLEEGYQAGIVSADQYRAALVALRSEVLGFSNPFDALADKQRQLDALFQQGVITADEYQRAMQDAEKSLFGLAESPTDKMADYNRQVQNLVDLWKQGKIDGDKFWDTISKYQQENFGIGPSMQQQVADFQRAKENLDKLLSNKGITQSQYTEELKKSLPEFIKGITESTRTPLERFQEQTAKLREWASSGLITPDLFQRQMSALKKELGLGTVQFATASEFGSSEARADILRNKFAGQANDPKMQIVDIEKQHLDVAKNQADALKTLVQQGDNVTVLKLP